MKPTPGATWSDYVVLVYVSLTTLILILFCIALIIYRRRQSMRLRNLPLLWTIACAALIHIWGAMITDEHFPVFIRLEASFCIFWNYWFQYFLGLAVWMIAVLIHCVVYGCAFHAKITDAGFAKIHRWSWMIWLLFGLPLLVILIHASDKDYSVLSEGTGLCESDVRLKAEVGGWIVFTLLSLLFAANFLSKNMGNDPTKQLRILLQTIVLGTVIICVNAIFIFLSLLEYPFVRFCVTGGVTTLHLFFFLRTLTVPIYKEIARGFSGGFAVLNEDVSMDLHTLSDVPEMPELGLDFLKMCETKQHFKDDSDNVQTPKDLVSCYKKIQMWKTQLDNKSSQQQQTLQDLMKIFSDPGSEIPPDYIKLPKNLKRELFNQTYNDKSAFDNVAGWITYLLNTRFATEYLKSEAVARCNFDRTQLENALKNARNQKGQNRLALANLFSYSSIKKEQKTLQNGDIPLESFLTEEALKEPDPPLYSIDD